MTMGGCGFHGKMFANFGGQTLSEMVVGLRGSSDMRNGQTDATDKNCTKTFDVVFSRFSNINIYRVLGQFNWPPPARANGFHFHT